MPKSISLILSVGVQHDVLGLQVAVHHAILVDIVQRVQNPQRDVDRPRGRHLALLEHHLTQQAPVHPLHRHVHPGPVLVGEDAHHVGVVQRQSDRLLALEAVEQGRIGFHGEVRDFQRYLTVVPQVRRPVDGRHAALGNRRINAVMVKDLACFKGSGKAHGLAFNGLDALALSAQPDGRLANLFEYSWAACCG